MTVVINYLNLSTSARWISTGDGFAPAGPGVVICAHVLVWTLCLPYLGHELLTPVAWQVSARLLSVSDTEVCCGFPWISFLATAKTHSRALSFAARCVFKSSSHIIRSRSTLNLLIYWLVSYYRASLCIQSSHYASWRPDQVRRKGLFVFVDMPDVSLGFTQLTRSLLTWEGQDALLMFLWPDTLGTQTLPSAGALLHLWPCSLAFHLREFLMLLSLFDSVLFMSFGQGKGYLSPQRSISPCDVSWLAAAQQFWNTFTARENPSECEGKHWKTHIWGGKKAGKAVSGGRSRLGEPESAGQRLRYIREQMNGS